MGDGNKLINALSIAFAPAESRDRGAYGVMSGSHFRWVLPEDATTAVRVMGAWSPYSLTSRLKWGMLRLAIGGVGPRCVPGISRLNPLPYIPADIAERFGVDAKRGCSMVVYVGTPGPQRKAVCHLVGQDGEIAAIVKVPLEDGARAALSREATNLKLITKELPVVPVPTLLHYDRPSYLTSQSILPGKPSGRAFGAAHAGFLLALRRDGNVDLGVRAATLIARIKSASYPWDMVRADAWLKTLHGPVPAVWQHGDFAPWNLRQHHGVIGAFDWEDADPDGLPVWDIAHFHTQQAFLFSESGSPLSAIEQNYYYSLYLNSIGITSSLGRALYYFYCIENSLKQFEFGHKALASYLHNQFSVGHVRK